jgi:hypothetical protein
LSDILTKFVLRPPPSNGILHLEFDGHTSLTQIFDVLEFLVVMLRTHVGIWVEGFGVDFDEVRHADDPVITI